ncbi:hypothetical protein ACQRC6_01200 [Peptoniphilus sp. SGI.035]|uniref:hypothetical protein n=1 Tax=Peptoniphilus sp. SGI.035 TaxID=3420564 RepID=UPI003D06A392
MIYQEALKAMKNRSKVRVGGIVYKHINAIIFRKTETKEMIELELQSNCQNSVTIADIAQAEVIDES